MSEGPVYCPRDGQELSFVSTGKVSTSHFACERCGLRWNGQFPLADNVKEEETA